jgi:thiamine biosynthesis lipoprotein
MRKYNLLVTLRLSGYFLLVSLMLTSCNGQDTNTHRFAGSTMGTTYHVTLVNPPVSLDVEEVQQGVQRVLDGVNGLMSTYLPESELMRFNKSEPGNWFEVSSQTAEVVALAQSISEKSDGYFDTTVGPLVNLWGFGPGADYLDNKVPDEEEIVQLLEKIGYQAVSVRLDPPALRKSKPVSLDLSAIAKGYAVDKVAEYLGLKGLENYLAEVGGELRTLGVNSRGLPWRVGIESPGMDGSGPQLAIRVSGKAVATSGDYRNYYEVEGHRYSHTLDPRTGRPITHNLASVTVIADTASEADGWATALSVMGAQKGLELAQEQGLAVYFIIRKQGGFTTRFTEAFADYFGSKKGV